MPYLREVRTQSPCREDFECRCRIADLYQAWRFEGGKRLGLSHPQDRRWWEYMEMIREVIDEMAAEGILGA